MKFYIIALLIFSFSSYTFSPKRKVLIPESANKKFFKRKELNKSFLKVLNKNKKFSKKALLKAFKFFDENLNKLNKKNLCLSKDNVRNQKRIRNKTCLIIVDYTKSKKIPRLLVVNPQTGETELFYTAHGKGSHEKDKIKTGYFAKRFSNKSGSNMTSLGFYLTDNLYTSKKITFGPGPQNGLKLDGLNCTNNNARMRYIVMHTADYVQPINGDPNKIGNSEGCITLPEHRKDIIQKCRNGALVYTYYKKT